MTQTEALRLALEALKEIIHWYAVRDRNDVLLNFVDQNPEIKKAMTAITAIEAALEAKDEPVVWNEGVPAMLPKQKEGETFIVSYEPKLEAKDEPVALVVYRGEICYKSTDDDQSFGIWCPVNYDSKHEFAEGTKFYTTPPQRKPLTDEEIQQIFIANSVVVDNGNAYMVAGLRTVNIARAIEAAHGIKGEA